MYELLANLKKAVSIEESDESFDAVLTQMLNMATEAIDEHCQRTFTKSADGVVRRFYAHQSPILWLEDDCLAVTAVSVAGTALTDDQYVTDPLNLTSREPHFTKIYKLSGSVRSDWTTQEQVIVSVTGTWGYAATVPYSVQQACKILAARMWARDKAMYENQSGASSAGFGFIQAPKPSMDADSKMLLDPFVKRFHFANMGGR